MLFSRFIFSTQELVLRVAPSAWGLPTWHAASLQLVLHLEMAQVPYRVQSMPYLYSPSTGSLPALQVYNKIIANENILDFLKKVIAASFHSDRGFTVEPMQNVYDLDENYIDALSYRVLIVERLEPLILHLFYDDDQNFSATILPLFGASLPFPISAYLPRLGMSLSIIDICHHGDNNGTGLVQHVAMHGLDSSLSPWQSGKTRLETYFSLSDWLIHITDIFL